MAKGASRLVGSPSTYAVVPSGRMTCVAPAKSLKADAKLVEEPLVEGLLDVELFDAGDDAEAFTLEVEELMAVAWLGTLLAVEEDPSMASKMLVRGLESAAVASALDVS